MQKLFRVAAPSRAFVLAAACLVTPQVVESEMFSEIDDNIIALAHGIDHLIDATGLTSKIGFGRNLQLGQSAAALFDNDMTTKALSTVLDEKLVQCAQESEAFFNANPGVKVSVDTFVSTMTTTPFYEAGIIGVVLGYPDEGQESVRQACADAGGRFVKISEPIQCTVYDDETGYEIETIISGSVNCESAIESCDAGYSFDIVVEGFEHAGNVCNPLAVIVDEATVEEEPKPDEPKQEGTTKSVTLAAEKESKPDEPKRKEDSNNTSAGAGHQWGLGYGALVGILILVVVVDDASILV